MHKLVYLAWLTTLVLVIDYVHSDPVNKKSKGIKKGKSNGNNTKTVSNNTVNNGGQKGPMSGGAQGLPLAISVPFPMIPIQRKKKKKQTAENRKSNGNNTKSVSNNTVNNGGRKGPMSGGAQGLPLAISIPFPMIPSQRKKKKKKKKKKQQVENSKTDGKSNGNNTKGVSNDTVNNGGRKGPMSAGAQGLPLAISIPFPMVPIQTKKKKKQQKSGNSKTDGKSNKEKTKRVSTDSVPNGGLKGPMSGGRAQGLPLPMSIPFPIIHLQSKPPTTNKSKKNKKKSQKVEHSKTDNKQ